MRYEWTVKAMKQLVHFCGRLSLTLGQELCCLGTGTLSSEHSRVSENFPGSEKMYEIYVQISMRLASSIWVFVKGLKLCSLWMIVGLKGINSARSVGPFNKFNKSEKKMQLDVGNESYLSQQWCPDHLLTRFLLECSQWQAQTYEHVIWMYLYELAQCQVERTNMVLLLLLFPKNP